MRWDSSTIIRRAGVAFLVLLVAVQVIRPARTNPPTDPAMTLAANTPMTPAVAAILDRSCRDCHSNETRWPWYSNVAPVSWLVIRDVTQARRQFNYSRWADYESEDRRGFLKDACAEVRKHDMPLFPYTWIHPSARLSDSDVRTFCDWTATALRPAH